MPQHPLLDRLAAAAAAETPVHPRLSYLDLMKKPDEHYVWRIQSAYFKPETAEFELLLETKDAPLWTPPFLLYLVAHGSSARATRRMYAEMGMHCIRNGEHGERSGFVECLVGHEIRNEPLKKGVPYLRFREVEVKSDKSA